MNKNLKYGFLFGLIFLVSCGGNGEVSSTNSDVGNSEESSSATVSLYDESPLGEREFRVRVLLPDGSPCYGEGTAVQWCSPVSCFMPVKIDANGYARTTIAEDGYDSYDVHLQKVPEGYTYNPSAYTQTLNNRDIEIVLSAVDAPRKENVNFTDAGGAEVDFVSEGVYAASTGENGENYYFAFIPSKPGKYQIESWAYDTSPISVTLGYHGGSSHYVTSQASETYTGGGEYGNVIHILNCSSDTFVKSEEGEIEYSGINYFFSLNLTGNGVFHPFDFSYVITYVGEADEPIVKTVEKEDINATETISAFPNKQTGQILTAIPLDGSRTYVYNETDRFYHLDSEEGPLVLVALNRKNPYIGTGIAKISSEAYGDPNYLLLDGDSKNYEPLALEYSQNCNSDGVYPATEELKVMIELIIQKNDYFNENHGFVSGQLDYKVENEYQWLYPCYFYRVLGE